MGNLCSKSSNSPDNFSTPGRTIDSTPSQPPKSASIPSQFKTTPGRTLGGNSTTTPSSEPPKENDAARRAREAAEQRYAQSQQSSGKLQQKLADQKRKTQNQVLKEGSEAERRNRDADATAEVRNYN